MVRQWNDAGAILDYMRFAKSYVAGCEERFWAREVERVLDAAHELMDHGVNRYQRKRRVSPKDAETRARDRLRYAEETYNDLWQRTLPTAARPDAEERPEEAPARQDPAPLPGRLEDRRVGHGWVRTGRRRRLATHSHTRNRPTPN